mgnify:CR=1 FL=1
MFNLTIEHLMLLSALVVVDSETLIDPVKPFGSTDILGDICDVLCITDRAYAETLWKQLPTALEIALSGQFAVGNYASDGENWRKV